jgi:hypothetical protein
LTLEARWDALALMRYAVVDPSGRSLHDIWGMHNVTAEAWLSLGVVALLAIALTGLAIRLFRRSAVQQGTGKRAAVYLVSRAREGGSVECGLWATGEDSVDLWRWRLWPAPQ